LIFKGQSDSYKFPVATCELETLNREVEVDIKVFGWYSDPSLVLARGLQAERVNDKKLMIA